MTLAPNRTERLGRARGDLRLGLPIVLAGGGEIELRVECLDGTLADIGAPWRTPRRPHHEMAEP